MRARAARPNADPAAAARPGGVPLAVILVAQVATFMAVGRRRLGHRAVLGRSHRPGVPRPAPSQGLPAGDVTPAASSGNPSHPLLRRADRRGLRRQGRPARDALGARAAGRPRGSSAGPSAWRPPSAMSARGPRDVPALGRPPHTPPRHLVPPRAGTAPHQRGRGTRPSRTGVGCPRCTRPLGWWSSSVRRAAARGVLGISPVAFRLRLSRARRAPRLHLDHQPPGASISAGVLLGRTAMTGLWTSRPTCARWTRSSGLRLVVTTPVRRPTRTASGRLTGRPNDSPRARTASRPTPRSAVPAGADRWWSGRRARRGNDHCPALSSVK